MTINLKIVSTLLGIIGSLFTAGYFVFEYHNTLATKKEVNLIFIELRLNDVEDSIENYSNADTLTTVEQRRYDRLVKTLSRLEGSRDKILGLGND